MCNLFAIPKKSGGHRPIINLKPLNRFVEYEHFKMESLKSVKFLVREREWMTKVDLKDAYLTVPVHLEHQKYLRFYWGNKLFQFSYLPFGLASAPRIFTKLLKPVIGHLRKQGIRFIIYLDDILIVSSSEEEARKDVRTVTGLLQLHYQLGEVNYHALTSVRVFRLSHRFPRNVIQPPESQSHGSKKALRYGTKSGQGVLEVFSLHLRKFFMGNSRYTLCSEPLPQLAKVLYRRC